MIRILTVIFVLSLFWSSAESAELLYTLVSPEPSYHGYFGGAVSGAGDINADGYEDIIVGAEGEGQDGNAHIFNGRTGELLYSLTTPELYGSDIFGCSVAGPGDLNGNGFDDVVIGMDGTVPGDMVMVFDGESGDLLWTLRSPAEDNYGEFGRKVATAGDVNNDGRQDFIVAARLEDSDLGTTLSGKAYVFSGNECQHLLTLTAPVEKQGAFFGSSISGAGDVNGDGYDDLIVGADSEDSDDGMVEQGGAYVFSGETGANIWTLESPIAHAYGYFGRSVAGIGDVNNDGFHDVAVAELGPSYEGLVHVYDGRTGEFIRTFMSPGDAASHFGTSMCGVPDINGNGYGDILIGALYDSPGTSPNLAGRAYLFDVATGELLSIFISPNEQLEGYFGSTVAYIGDVNGDGMHDVIIGAEREEPDGAPSYVGRSYVFSIGPVRGPQADHAIPNQLFLRAPRPHPVRRTATIEYYLANPPKDTVELTLMDIGGKVVDHLSTEPKNMKSWNSIHWQNDFIHSGLYLWRLKTGEAAVYQPMVVIR